MPHKAVVPAAGVYVCAHDDGASVIDPRGNGAPRAWDGKGPLCKGPEERATSWSASMRRMAMIVL